MASSEHDYLMSVRAAKIRYAKLLQEERACVLEEVAAIERKLGMKNDDEMKKGENVTIPPVTSS